MNSCWDNELWGTKTLLILWNWMKTSIIYFIYVFSVNTFQNIFKRDYWYKVRYINQRETNYFSTLRKKSTFLNQKNINRKWGCQVICYYHYCNVDFNNFSSTYRTWILYQRFINSINSDKLVHIHKSGNVVHLSLAGLVVDFFKKIRVS